MRFAKYALATALAAWFLVSAQDARSETAQKKISVLVVTGHDVASHPWRETTPFTRKVLEETGRFDVKVSEDSGIFESSTLGKYDAIVLNFGFWDAPELTEEARAGLLKFVSDGGGLVMLHFACSSYQEWKEYRELLGRVWVRGVGGHGPRHVFEVKITDHDHPITKGMESFKIDDECYAQLSGDAEIQVLATSMSNLKGKEREEPMVFVKTYGKGRVANNVLGHDMKSRDIEPYKTLLKRSVEWVVTGEVTVE
ncbi:MAG: ThuA domain-containing protein [Planctomycetes bacterium]|nr:ThuA domain-containing protein [Planctomycetota bacterium]